MASKTVGRRLWTLRALAVLAGLFVALGCLEALLRTLPVYDPPRRTRVDEGNPVLRFEPGREFLWSRGWDFSMVNRGRTNNVGFVSDFDYQPDAEGPLLAVIGDSYVEAAMVPFGETCAGRLAQRLTGKARVYAFGVSGSPLSQYLAFAEYARDTFRPVGLAVVIIDNDYDESLLKYRPVPGFHYFVEDGDGRLRLERADFERSLLHRLIRASALARYFAGNVDVRRGIEQLRRGIAATWEELLGGEAEHGPADAAGSASVEAARVTDSKRAVVAFLNQLPEASGLDPGRIVFVVDGLRTQLYRKDRLAKMAGTFRDVMRRYFLVEAHRRGYQTADLQPAMVAHFRAYRERFEWPQDIHWNALGHELCFDALVRSEVVSVESEGPGRPAGAQPAGWE